MIQQIGQALIFDVMYIESKVGKTGLTVTVDIYRNNTEILSAQATTEVGDGVYTYTLAGASVTVAGRYRAVFKTATTTVDQRDIGTVYDVGSTWVERIDAATSSVVTAITAATATIVAAVTSITSAVSVAFNRLLNNITPNVLTVAQGDTWAETITTSVFTWATGYELRLTVKEISSYKSSTSDADSILQWLLTFGGGDSDGLVYIKQAAAGASASKGSLAVINASTGQVTINLDEAVSLLLQGSFVWDLKLYTAAGDGVVTTLAGGTLVITPTVTYSIT